MKPKIPTALRRDKSHATVSQSQAAGFNPQGRSKPSAISVATGPPAVLRPMREADVEPIARWYDTATVLAGSPIALSDLLDSPGHRRILVLTDGMNEAPFGLIALTLDDPEPDWATVSLLAIARQDEQDMARWGVALLETHLRGEASHIRAAVPLDVGLALYFWLRLGYRPDTGDGRLWMIRDLDG